MNGLRTSRFTGIAWLIARLYLGYEWLIGGWEKVVGEGGAVWVGDKAGVAVAGFLKGAIAKSPLAEGFDHAKTPLSCGSGMVRHACTRRVYAECRAF